MSVDGSASFDASGLSRRVEHPLSSGADQGAELARYFHRVWEVFERAGARVPTVCERTFRLADCPVRLRIAGGDLESVLIPALAHLPRCDFDEGFEIVCWDGAATGMHLPAPPWPWPEMWPADGVFLPFGEDTVRVSVQPETGLITMFHRAMRRGVFWSRDGRELDTSHYGSPLLALFSWWAQSAESSLVHAACVGTDKGAAIFVGKGGSGKSTTSLLCAEAGLHYIGDDYCIVRPAPAPTAFSLYSSGKLHREHLAAFPRLKALAIDPRANQFAKPVAFLSRERGYAVVDRLPLRAVVVPVITGRPDSSIEPASAAEALRALAPSTLFQLPGDGTEPFRMMARLVRAVPCFRMNLGARFETIPPAVESLLARLR